jgi:hypothetical protein
VPSENPVWQALALRPPSTQPDASADPTSGTERQRDGVATALGSPGRPLDAATRAYMELRFGHDFGGVRVHSGASAAAAARGLGARAFTSGLGIALDGERGGSGSRPEPWLIAHELAHVVQAQRLATAGPGRAPAVSRPDDASERSAVAAADVAVSPGGGDAKGIALKGVEVSSLSPIQREHEPPSSRARPAQQAPAYVPRSDPNALIPIADFIRYVEEVEHAYPTDTPEQIVTRIRQLYYSGATLAGADELIPDSPMTETVPAWVPRRDFLVRGTETRRRTVRYGDVSQDTYRHLTAHADENAIGDNPSPYILLPDGGRADVGHLLLGVDALLHPRTGWPYADFGVANIGPASWVADLGFASMWMTQHEESGSSPPSAPVHPPAPDMNAYFRASAPDEDLLGDVESFGVNEQRGRMSGANLSQVLRAYYLGSAGAAAGSQSRFQTFCARNFLTYARSGATITWNRAAIESVWRARIDRATDLFAGGAGGALASAVRTPPARQWPHTSEVLGRFLDWLKPRLERELAAAAPTPNH